MKNKRNIFIFSVIIILIGFTFNAQSQISSTTEYFLQNKQSKKILDVKGGNRAAGTQIWQFDLNYSKAQVFRIVQHDRSENHTYRISSQISYLYLSLKHNLAATTSSPSTIEVKPPIEVTGEAPSSNNTVLHQFNIIQDERYTAPSSPIVSYTKSQPNHQIWKVMAVPNEPNTYIIQSTAFADDYVLQPVDNNSTSTLVLANYTGRDNQKWIILPTKPEAVTELNLSEFKWEANGFLFLNGEITGKLKWKDNSLNEDGFEIFVKRKEENGSYTSYLSLGTVTTNQTASTFAGDSKQGKGKTHCFIVKSYNKWGTATSREVCKLPEYEVPQVTSARLTIYIINHCYIIGEGCRGLLSEYDEKIVFTPISLNPCSDCGVTQEFTITLPSTLASSPSSYGICAAILPSVQINLAPGNWNVQFKANAPPFVTNNNLNFSAGVKSLYMCYRLPSTGIFRIGSPPPNCECQ